jgi:hypothetical protein
MKISFKDINRVVDILSRTSEKILKENRQMEYKINVLKSKNIRLEEELSDAKALAEYWHDRSSYWEENYYSNQNTYKDLLEWFLNLANGCSKGGGKPDQYEWEDCIEQTKQIFKESQWDSK